MPGKLLNEKTESVELSVLHPEGTKAHIGAGDTEDPTRSQALDRDPEESMDGPPACDRSQTPRPERQGVTAVGNWAALVLGIVCPGKVPGQKCLDARGGAVLG